MMYFINRQVLAKKSLSNLQQGKFQWISSHKVSAGVAAPKCKGKKVPIENLKKLSWAAFFAGFLPDADLFIYSAARPCYHLSLSSIFLLPTLFVPFGAVPYLLL
ncbi:MAG: hypothetical protein U0T83_02865 [Bacteriovoracaceae bacterium]